MAIAKPQEIGRILQILGEKSVSENFEHSLNFLDVLSSGDTMPASKRPVWQSSSREIQDELEGMAGTSDYQQTEVRSLKPRARELLRSPEKHPRSDSPGVSSSHSESKHDRSKLNSYKMDGM